MKVFSKNNKPNEVSIESLFVYIMFDFQIMSVVVTYVILLVQSHSLGEPASAKA